MKQPPQNDESPGKPAAWRRPIGVTAGTWDYVYRRSIADRYDAFVADTPLCRLDQQILQDEFPDLSAAGSQTVLDLGCGTGRTAMTLAARGYDVVGVDLSQPMLEQCVGKCPNEALAGRVFSLRANLVELGCLADASADHAVCLFSTLGMICGRAHRRRMLGHVARIVRPGGKLVLHVHHRWAGLRERGGTVKLAGSLVRSLVDGRHEFGDATYRYRGLEHMFMHRFSRREIAADLATTGWHVDRVDRVSIDGGGLVGRTKIAGGFIVVADLRHVPNGMT